MAVELEDPPSDVLINSAEARTWLSISHDELDGLVTRGVLKPILSRENLKPVFDANAVARIAAKRSRTALNG
jgi:hypothetical protein